MLCGSCGLWPGMITHEELRINLHVMCIDNFSLKFVSKSVFHIIAYFP